MILFVLAARGFLDFLPRNANEYLIPGIIAGVVFVFMLYKILQLTGKIDF